LFGGAGLSAMWLLVKTAPKRPDVLPPITVPGYGGVDAFGANLFTHGILPFELSSALLMVAIIGALAVAQGRHKSKAQEAKEETPTAHAPARKLSEGES
jgi:NADH-quinone oxidoreductase subunit J